MRLTHLLPLLLVACQSAPQDAGAPSRDGHEFAMTGVVLVTDRLSYSAGDEVRLTLRNETDYELGHNLCVDSRLERRADAAWQSVSLEPRDPCPSLLALMPPGESASYPFRLSPGLPEGEYRFRSTVEHMNTGQRHDHVTATFRVGRQEGAAR